MFHYIITNYFLNSQIKINCQLLNSSIKERFSTYLSGFKDKNRKVTRNFKFDILVYEKFLFNNWGTGSFGKAFWKTWKKNTGRIVIYSRDELKQSELQEIYPKSKYLF